LFIKPAQYSGLLTVGITTASAALEGKLSKAREVKQGMMSVLLTDIR